MAVRAVQGDIAWLRRVGDQRPLRRLHLGEPAPSRPQAPPGERIVTAGIQEQQVEPRPGPLHLTQDEVGIEQLEIHIRFPGRIGADRHQIVGPPHLDPMPGVIEERDPSALDDGAKLLHHAVEGCLIEIELRLAPHQCEAHTLEGIGNEACIARRIGEPRHMLVLAIANHECHPAFRWLRHGTPRQE